jgi:hypothetical protein
MWRGIESELPAVLDPGLEFNFKKEDYPVGSVITLRPDNPDGKIVNNNWYCPEPFRAEKISYTRDFRQQTQIGISRGWESLALPFAVQTITHQDKGAIAPFGSDASGLHFWLRRLGHEGLISVQMIEPNTPYIISMPNSEDYASRFNLNGRVTFAAEDAYVERTEQMEDESADYMMVPTFQRMPVSEYVYALNVGEERNGRPEGSIFERNYREVRPFEAYTLHRGDQPAPLFFDLSDLEGSTTDMPDVRWKTEDDTIFLDALSVLTSRPFASLMLAMTVTLPFPSTSTSTKMSADFSEIRS